MQQKYLLIIGKNSKDKVFRPSDWAERICDQLASYGGSPGYTKYHRYALPVVVDGVKAVRLNFKTESAYPRFWNFVTGFAKDNDLIVCEETVITPVQETVQMPTVISRWDNYLEKLSSRIWPDTV